MLFTNKLFKSLGVTILLGCLTACASTGKTAADAIIKAESSINPNAAGQATPVVMVFYQLKDISNFKNAEFFSLYQNPRKTLGEDYLTSQQAIITPGETKKLTIALEPDTRFIGVVTAFQQLNAANWQTVIPVSHRRSLPTFKLSIDKTTIQPLGAK